MRWGISIVLAAALTLWVSLFVPTGPVAEFAFAWLLHWTLMAGAAVAVPQTDARIAGSRDAGFLAFEVGAGESGWYRALGVPAFNRLLDVAGWNRIIKRVRGYAGRRSELAGLAGGAWRSEQGHTWVLLTILLVAAPLWVLRPGVVAWLLLLALPFHVYPIMLQRLLRWRIQQIGRR